MPNWNQVLEEIQSCDYRNPLDYTRRKYISLLSQKTTRNVICYYSGWIQKPGIQNTGINDDDKNALMAMVHGLDRKKGLDLVLHTPGGDLAATESIVDYLHRMFPHDIRAIIPQLAMSAGTMIAFACKSIVMGKQSSLGPIDPQFGGIPAYGVIKEFKQAIQEVKDDPQTIPIWCEMIRKYHPTFIGECQNAIDWSVLMVNEWLKNGMLKNKKGAEAKAKKIVDYFNNHDDTKSHARHIHIDDAKSTGLIIEDMESDQELQDLILTVHHAFMHTFANSQAFKIIENQQSNSVILLANS